MAFPVKMNCNFTFLINNKRRSSKATRSSTFIDKLADQTTETINSYDNNVLNPLEMEISNYANLNVTVCAQDQDIAKAQGAL